jgi:hypothetical protein
MRLIRLYAARACFRVSTWLAMLGKWFAGPLNDERPQLL